jgi:hypothetical protein
MTSEAENALWGNLEIVFVARITNVGSAINNCTSKKPFSFALSCTHLQHLQIVKSMTQTLK